MSHSSTISNEYGVDLAPARKLTTEDSEPDLTPMIDIVFLLLSFFVVGSKIDPQFALDLPFAVSGENVSDKVNVSLVIKRKDGVKGQFEIYKGDTSDNPTALIRETDPLVIEAEVADYVEKEFSRHPEFQAVLIKAEGEVTTGIVQTVKRGVSLSEMAKTRRIFLAVKEGD
jgi:biopolymer transport protein TolR